MNTRNLTCIGCPLGCPIKVTFDDDKIASVEGNTCKRGYEYAVNEVTDPKRTLTSTVKVSNRDEMLSVKTDKAISFPLIDKVMEKLRNVKVKAPIKIGDIILENCDGKNTNIIATKNID